jgi:hypothetical protein
MYVQIDDKIREGFESNIICSMFMGSHAHGLNNSTSDIDILWIYQEKESTLFSEDNGWQFKSDVCDYNYQSLRTFIRNCIKGDSPADFEALMSGWKFSQFNKLMDAYKVDEIFTILRTNRSYALLKSYLGYVKKDGKYILSTLTESTAQTKEICNKLSHMYRGIETVKLLMNNEEYVFCDGHVSDMRWQRAWAYKNIAGVTTNAEIINIVNELFVEYESLKNKLNTMLDNRGIVRRFDIEKLKQIESIYASINQTSVYDFGDLNYHITEKGMTHQYV